MLYSLKAHEHYFTVFMYLQTWRGAKRGIFTYFTFTNLPWFSQSMNSLIYVYSIQIPSWSQMWSHFFIILLPKKILCINPWSVFVFYLGISTNKGRVSTPGKSGNLLGDQEKSGKFDIFWKKSEKSMQKCMQKCVQLNFTWQSVVYMMILFASSIKNDWILPILFILT